MKVTKASPFCLLLAAAALGGAGAAETAYKLEALKEAAPAEAGDKTREALGAEGIRVLDPKGKPFVDFWLRKSVPTREPGEDEPGVKFGQLAEGTLLGVARFHRAGSDYKANDFPAGIYTMRNGIQPRDGDHLGVSETRDFILLSPVKADTGLDPVPGKDLVKLSTQASGISHPAVLYLVKAADDAKPPRVLHDEDNERWIVECEVATTGKEKALRLGLVIVGKGAEG
jgi:hypothetical protein